MPLPAGSEANPRQHTILEVLEVTFFDDLKLSFIFQMSGNPNEGKKMKTLGKVIIKINYINLL